MYFEKRSDDGKKMFINLINLVMVIMHAACMFLLATMVELLVQIHLPSCEGDVTRVCWNANFAF